MLEFIPAKLVEELKSAPYTMLTQFVLIGAVSWLATDHVSKYDLSLIRADVRGVQATLVSDHLDNRYHSVQKDLFEITRSIQSSEKKGIEVPQLDYERRDSLTGQLDDIQREMARTGQQVK